MCAEANVLAAYRAAHELLADALLAQARPTVLGAPVQVARHAPDRHFDEDRAFTSARYYPDPGCDLPCTRLSFTYLDEHELAEAVTRMKRALIQISGRAGST
ncbi:MAG: hypothetical protein WKG01_22890 [Kofleriaceae bacterium]